MCRTTCTTDVLWPQPRFTGKERDTESNLYNSGARYYTSTYGRFMSADPGNAGADPTNPQSWNMYSYVLNNPLNAIDPTGMNCVWDDGSFDAQDDPWDGDTDQGRQTCKDAGGTWFANVTGDWDPHPNAVLADLALKSQEVDSGICPDICSVTNQSSQTPETGDDYINAISYQLAPLAKLQDCTAGAVADQVPFGRKILGAPDPPKDPVDKKLDEASTVIDAVDKLGHNTYPAMVVLTLNKLDLPFLSGMARNTFTKIVPAVAPFAEKLAPVGWGVAAAQVAHGTYACYNTPGR
jgi:RHS repeat-associated protein